MAYDIILLRFLLFWAQTYLFLTMTMHHRCLALFRGKLTMNLEASFHLSPSNQETIRSALKSQQKIPYIKIFFLQEQRIGPEN